MRVGHIMTADGPRLAVERDGARFDARHILDEGPITVDELIQHADAYLPKLNRAMEDLPDGAAASDETWASPLVRPTAVIAIGLNYHDHCREFGTEPPSTPMVFSKLAGSIIGDGDCISWSEAITSEVDWEAELAVVIGAEASNISAEEAERVIFGYTVLNDVTARDIQAREQQWVRAKSLRTFCPLGPVIVTRDEIADVQSLAIRSRVNGQTMQDSNTREMVFSVAELVAYLSHSFALRPGDVIATGTPFGVGAFRSPPIYLHDGDAVEVEIEGIGTLKNLCSTTSE